MTKKDITRKTRIKIGFSANKESWRSSPAVFNSTSLQIQGHPVMENWEDPYMKALAKIVTTNGGIILEFGFGMGIAARYIDQANIKKHIIIEANHEVANKARDFARIAKHRTEIVEGFAEQVILDFPKKYFDGILCDVYPLNPDEIHQDNYKFFQPAYQLLKVGGVLTYYSDEAKEFSNYHKSLLLKVGFRNKNISGQVVKVKPPKDCLYWRYDSFLAPQVVR